MRVSDATTLVQYRGLKLLTGNDASVADGPV
jgi:hypothetical protein